MAKLHASSAILSAKRKIQELHIYFYKIVRGMGIKNSIFHELILQMFKLECTDFILPGLDVAAAKGLMF